jgi:hypothetical protein
MDGAGGWRPAGVHSTIGPGSEVHEVRYGDPPPPDVRVEFADQFDPMNPDVPLELLVDGEFSREVEEQLSDHLMAWYRAGFVGAFGKGFHFMSDIRVEAGHPTRIMFWVDMGSRFNEIALDALVRTMNSFNAHPWRLIPVPPAKLDRLVQRIIVGDGRWVPDDSGDQVSD